MSTVFQGVTPDLVNKYKDVAPARVINAVSKAASKTGVDFQFLMEKAKQESSFNPAARARTSSATGLFQFIEQTWLNMVKKHGAKYGLENYADKIEVKGGKASVADNAAKQQILALRKNPEICALMAGEYTAENIDVLKNCVEGPVGATEMYLAHFMGAGAAAKFISAREEDGSASAAALFPGAARANKNVFYDRATGNARSLDQVYALFDRKFNGGNASSPPIDAAASPTSPTAAQRSAQAPASDIPPALPRALSAQAQLLSEDAPDISRVWSDTPRSAGFSNPKSPVTRLSPMHVVMLSEMQQGLAPHKPRADEARKAYYGRHLYNS